MELNEFRKKLAELHEKSGMDSFLDWPFVYDEDENGDVYISDNGTFHLRNRNHDWQPISLNIRDVSAMRYEVVFDEGGVEHNEDTVPKESCIYIYFSHGEIIHLLNRHDSYDIELRLILNKLNDENEKKACLDFLVSRARSEVYIGKDRLKASEEK